MYGSDDREIKELKRELVFYQDRYERERYEEMRRSEQEYSRREEERRERRRREEDSMRQANTWPEAFRKQRILYEREVEEFAAYRRADPEGAASCCQPPSFEEWLVANNRAADIFREEQNQVADQEMALRAECEARIAALQEGARQKVIDKLREEFTQGEADLVIDALEANDPNGYLYW